MVCEIAHCKKPSQSFTEHSEEREDFFEQNWFTPLQHSVTTKLSSQETVFQLIHLPLSPLSPLLYFTAFRRGKDFFFKVSRCYLTFSNIIQNWGLNIIKQFNSGSQTLVPMRIPYRGTEMQMLGYQVHRLWWGPGFCILTNTQVILIQGWINENSKTGEYVCKKTKLVIFYYK